MVVLRLAELQHEGLHRVVWGLHLARHADIYVVRHTRLDFAPHAAKSEGEYDGYIKIGAHNFLYSSWWGVEVFIKSRPKGFRILNSIMLVISTGATAKVNMENCGLKYWAHSSVIVICGGQRDCESR